MLEIIGRVRCNVLISGGTGSGKTTLLNCLTGSIDDDERIITCEDSAELQLQQPHVVRLETRPPNLEGEGEITMRDLVRNCLRMRPERIIVGEVRGPEAFDLLQAMNTGHDGSMGTLHANSPREAISRLESMIMMGGFQLPPKTIREMITGSIDVIVQASRLRDGSRKITHITEVVGMEGDVVTLQNLIVFEITGEDAQRQDHRPPPLHRHRPPALLGARRVLRRDGAPGAGAGGRRGARQHAAIRWETRVASNDLLLARPAAAGGAVVGAVVYLLVNPYFSGERRSRQAHPGRDRDQGRRRIAVKAQADAVQSRRQPGRRHAEGAGGPPEGARKGARCGCAWSAPGSTSRRASFWIASVVCGVARRRRASGCRRRTCRSSCRCWRPSSARSACRAGSLARLTKRRQTKFIDEFANAIDIIVRGVKSGLPLNECLAIIARESAAAAGRRVHRARRAAARRRAAGRGLRAHDDAHAAARGALLRHRHRHPAAGRRQPVGGARQPVRRAARPQAAAGQGAALSAEAKASAAVLGVAAVRRHDPRLHHDARLHRRCSGPRTSASSCCCAAAFWMTMRHPGDAEDDQLQVLRRAAHRHRSATVGHVDLIDTCINPQFVVTLLAAIAAFATVLTVLMPVLSRDRLNTRMQVMATERDKMRAARLADLAKKDGQGRLRTAPKGFMQEIVDKLNLRSVFDTEEVRDKLKMAGLRGQAPLVAYMFFRVAMPVDHRRRRAALPVRARRLRLSRRWSRSALALGAGYFGFYLPNMFIENLVQRRQTSIKNAFPDALDMLLICVQSGMSVEAAFGKVSSEVGSQSLELAEELSLTTAELSYLQDRRQAFENLGKRTGIPGSRRSPPR